MSPHFTWSDLERHCKHRPPGYREAILAAAQDIDANGFCLPPEAIEAVRRRFNLQETEILVKLSDLEAGPYADHPGALTAMLASGRVEGDHLILSPESYARLRAAYGVDSRCAGCGR